MSTGLSTPCGFLMAHSPCKYNKSMKTECPNFDCNRPEKDCCTMFRKITIPAVLGDDSEGSEVAPCNGAYRNALVEYEANGALYIYSSDGIFTKLYYTASEIEGAATVSYTDAKSAQALQAAKNYTNNAISQMGPTNKTYVDQQDAATLQSAKAYADTKDAAVLQEAKNYADQAVGSGVTQNYVDQHDASTLQSAKDYANNQITSAIAADQAQQVKLILTDTDPGEGSPLPANTLLGVYRGE